MLTNETKLIETKERNYYRFKGKQEEMSHLVAFIFGFSFFDNDWAYEVHTEYTV